MDAEGIRNGSAKNERNSNTINTTGKKDRAYSTAHGSLASSKTRPLDLRNSK